MSTKNDKTLPKVLQVPVDLTEKLILSSLCNWPLSMSTFADFMISQERATLPPGAILTGTWELAEGIDVFMYQMFHDVSLAGAVDLELMIDGKAETRFAYTIMGSHVWSPFQIGPPVKVAERFWFKITNTAAMPVSIALTILWFRMKEEVWQGLYELFEEYLGVLPR